MMEDINALVAAAADAAKIDEEKSAAKAPEVGGKRKRVAKTKAKRKAKKKRASPQQATRPRRASAGAQAPRYAPQRGHGDPWADIEFIADSVKPESADVRQALRHAALTSDLMLGRDFRSSTEVLEVAWQGDRIGWGVRWIGDVVLGAKEVVGVFAGRAIALDATTPEEARWIFDTGKTDGAKRHIYIDLLRSGNALRFANHSCDPNCVARRGKVQGLDVPILRVRGDRVLHPGDWVSFSYGPQATAGATVSNQRCRCGAANCTGWIFPPTEEERAALRNKRRAKVQRKLAELDAKRALLVEALVALRSPSPLVGSDPAAPLARPLKAHVRRAGKHGTLAVSKTFFAAGHISHGGVTYYRQAEPQASGANGIVWYLWPTSECAGTPVAVLKLATAATITSEVERWSRASEKRLDAHTPLFPSYLGKVNRGHCSPKIPRNLDGIILSFAGHAIYNLASDTAIIAPLSAANITAAAFQIVWAVRALQLHCQLQHGDLHNNNITYVVQPSLITAWFREKVWQFESLLVLRIIDLGNATLIKPSEHTLHVDMKRALGGLSKACKKQGADITKLRHFIAQLDNNSIRSSSAIEHGFFAGLVSLKTLNDISETAQRAIGMDPKFVPSGMMIQAARLDEPAAASGPSDAAVACAVCGFFPRKAGKLYCCSPACKAAIKTRQQGV